MKSAQQLINESNIPDFKEMFYPEKAKLEQADLNITKCLRRLKRDDKRRNK